METTRHRKYVVEGTKIERHEMKTVTTSRLRAAEKFRADYGLLPDLVEVVPSSGSDEDESEIHHIVGACEGCDKIIFEDDKYGTDPDGDCYCCMDCADPSDDGKRIHDLENLLKNLLPHVRCQRTGNPVGTDTMMYGLECPCEPCKLTRGTVLKKEGIADG